MPSCPDYVVIGHITRDIYDGGYKLGGTATFSALTAHSLGRAVGIVTSTGLDIDLARLPADISIASHRSESSTTFENLYLDGHRRQFLWSQAQLLTYADIPEAWRASPIVHLGPVAQEVDQTIAGHFRHALLGLTPQGWMRGWDEGGIVHPAAWRPPDALLRRADAVILSEEDVGGDMNKVRAYAAQTRLLVLTAGWKGSTVYCEGQVRSFPAPRVREIDPTGAGDVFAAVFLVVLQETQDPWFAAQFANCVAAHSVERSGLDSIPTRQEIDRCRARFHYRYPAPAAHRTERRDDQGLCSG
jgi:sugar/nucleoside kinase (ribokinase family)